MKTSLEDTQLFDDLMKELEAFRVTISDEPETKNTPDPFAARVWVVDDASVNVKVVEKHLRAEGYRNIQGFTNPRHALERLETEAPDVVLLDIMMPEISGIEVLAILRSRPATRHTPILILSASNDRDTRLEALELGATDFLEKPVDRVELIVRLRNSLALKTHHDRLEQYSERLEVVHCLARA
ncbi:MAG: response regulator [Planctomycetaceae bacterium]